MNPELIFGLLPLRFVELRLGNDFFHDLGLGLFAPWLFYWTRNFLIFSRLCEALSLRPSQPNQRHRSRISQSLLLFGLRAICGF
jgi:hypothetical protein